AGHGGSARVTLAQASESSTAASTRGARASFRLPAVGSVCMERLCKVVCTLMLVEDPLARLQEGIGYTFEDTALLLDALTHRSFLNERPNLARCDNERMEFLGDAILNLAASALLWRQYPTAS